MSPVDVLYFAYGSNLTSTRLSRRVGSIHPVTIAWLEGYALRFHKVSPDGSGKCNAFYTGRAQDRLYGVIFHIKTSALPVLDHCEELDHGYTRHHTVFQTPAFPLTASLYIAQQHYIDDRKTPYTWYHSFVENGAREFGLPPAYIEHSILNVTPRDDHCAERTALNLEILNSCPFKKRAKV